MAPLMPFFFVLKITNLSCLEFEYSKSDFTVLFPYVSNITFLGAKRPILSE